MQRLENTRASGAPKAGTRSTNSFLNALGFTYLANSANGRLCEIVAGSPKDIRTTNSQAYAASYNSGCVGYAHILPTQASMCSTLFATFKGHFAMPEGYGPYPKGDAAAVVRICPTFVLSGSHTSALATYSKPVSCYWRLCCWG